MSLLMQHLYSTFGQFAELEVRQEQKKKEILKEYDKTFKMPRKMKKQKRKELNLEWSIANWSPFKNFGL